MPDLNLNSETINKGIDLLADSTKETRNTLDTQTSKGLNKFFELLKSTSLGIKIDTYIAERPYKLELAMNEMLAKHGKIPVPNRTEPSSYIALQTIKNLNYALDEEYLKELFINILISDMDNRKKSRVKPAYIEMVKQLSKEDVEFLKSLKEKNILDSAPVLQLRFTNQTGGFVNISDKILIVPKEDNLVLSIPPIVLHNLLRLNIISIPFGLSISKYEGLYIDTFEKIKKNPDTEMLLALKPPDMKLDFEKEKLEITPLGKEIIDIEMHPV